MSRSWFEVDDYVDHPGHPPGGPKLVFQWGRYHYRDGSPSQDGYRFVWRLATGKLQSRGPARLPSVADIYLLTRLARRAGWGRHIGP